MIWESYPWKNQLIADAAIIKRWASKTQHTQRRSMLIERKVFLAAYIIRKLDDDYKLHPYSATGRSVAALTAIRASVMMSESSEYQTATPTVGQSSAERAVNFSYQE